jgi:hypothetical protein
MKTISLRTLLREPLKVKRMTRAGQSIQITDNGQPLWILQSANGTDKNDTERVRAIDELLDELLREKPSTISLSKLILDSRR